MTVWSVSSRSGPVVPTAAARRLEGAFPTNYDGRNTTEQVMASSPPNIARKMQAGALMPIFVEQGLDLSEAILEELHKDMKRESL
jgi:hypothetical protein